MERLVARAAATGADLVLLPEKWNGLGSHEILLDVAESLEGGETVDAMSGWARTHGITLVGGSIAERRDGRQKLSNTCVVFDPEGEIAAVYRKIHMFDVELGGVVYRESDSEEPGDRPVSCEVEGWRLGLSVCYDLRYPELYRILAVEGAELVTVPAAFTLFTGKDHWELLLRARAVENQCYVVAANQWGLVEGKASYGRSSIVDPWGVVLAQAPDEDAVITAELDRAHMDRIRQQPAVPREPPARRLHVAGGGLGPARAVEAVLFDVDFTLAKPGPLLGPEGYRRAGARHGLTLDPDRYPEARAAAVEDLEHHPELEHDEEIWIRFTEAIVRGMGGEGARRTRGRRGDHHGVASFGQLRAVRRRAPGSGRAARVRAQDRPHLEHEPRSDRLRRPLRPGRRRLDLIGRAREGEAEPDDLPGRARAARRRCRRGRDGGRLPARRRRGRPGARHAGVTSSTARAASPNRDDALPTLLALPALLAST